MKSTDQGDYNYDESSHGIDDDIASKVAEALILDPGSADDLVYERVPRKKDPFPKGTSITDRRRTVIRVQQLIDERAPLDADFRQQTLLELLYRALRNATDCASTVEQAVFSIQSAVKSFERERALARRWFQALGPSKSEIKKFAKLLGDESGLKDVRRVTAALGHAHRFADVADRNHWRATELTTALFGDDDYDE